jgi:queuine/archaeosine tRNA-ribosyltransferase
MRLLIITSCTGEKLHHPELQLTLEDFQKGERYLAAREKTLEAYLTSAEEIYTGDQHVRLMRGVKALRDAAPEGLTLDLKVLSAGYGLIPGAQRIAPYEATFATMKTKELRTWADTLNIPAAIRETLAQPYDFCLLLLGDKYLEACALDATVTLGGPTLMFCGTVTAKKLPSLPNLRVVTLSNPDAKRYSCGLVGLKGELAHRILAELAADPSTLATWSSEDADLLARLDAKTPAKPQKELGKPKKERAAKVEKAPSVPRAQAVANPHVDKVISIPSSWWEKPHRQKLRYFIPEWDDLVDPDYDFLTDTHSGGGGDWSNETYAHQMYPEPNYDGILISKVVAEKSTKKKERINRLGVHRFLRIPNDYPVMGDCGAFGYIMEETPPYTTAEILDYYTRLGFNYGVSLDHLIVTATEAQKQFRYDLTIHNAEEFLREHRKAGLEWEPIGAVQGWDPKSYAAAAQQCVKMGYKYIGLGGLVRSTTKDILKMLEEVHAVVPDDVHIHLFGIARLKAMHAFNELGVRSVDSASLLRRAWMGTGQNYLAMDGSLYAAIRIPEAGKSFRAKRMVSEGRTTAEYAEKLEKACLDALRGFDKGTVSVETAVDTIEEYDKLITTNRSDNRPLLRRVLEAKPWKECPCEICQKDGVEVILFRGNNRNRRRGFHNTYVFYKIFQRAVMGEQVRFGNLDEEDSSESQLSLFEPA